LGGEAFFLASDRELDMSDIKLFRIEDGQVQELAGGSVALEKSLQLLIERNLTVRTDADFERAKVLIQRSYEAN